MPFLKIFFRLEINRKEYQPPKGAFIVISNHGSFMDFAIVMLSIYPRRLNAVAAKKFFLFKPLNWLLPLMGCIPKNLFDPDPRSIIGVKTVLNRGGRVLLFPEGRCECDGFYAGMHKATGKLIKKLGVPVVSCSINGAYTCMPFWRKGIRFGRVRITVANLFSTEQLKSLSIDEINATIDNRLSRNEDDKPKKPFQTFGTKKLAEGLQYIIYWCPKCGEEFTTETKDCMIYCTTCGNKAEINREMKLTPTPGSIMPDSVHGWYRDQARYEAEKLHLDMEPIIVNVSVRLPSNISGKGMDECGKGIVKMDPKGWYYDGELRGEQVNLFFPIDTVPALPIDPNDVFQIYAHGTFYCFTPENPRTCVKYSVIGECAYWRFTSKIQMTPRKDSGFGGVV
jgi:1-acyl-sn-glycerol-3-phosphate acyltransferase